MTLEDVSLRLLWLARQRSTDVDLAARNLDPARS